MSPRQKAIVTAHIMLVNHGEDDDRILLSKRMGTGYYDGWWSLPAGHANPGEQPIAAAVREAREELGVELKPEDAHFAHVMHRHLPGEDRVDFFFIFTDWLGGVQNAEPHRCALLEWYPGWGHSDLLPSQMVPYVAAFFEFCGRGVMFSEFNWRIDGP